MMNEALSKGSEERVLDVFSILTLTFENLIGFLAILRSGYGNLRGWCNADCFYLCAVFFLLMSPWMYEIHLLS